LRRQRIELLRSGKLYCGAEEVSLDDLQHAGPSGFVGDARDDKHLSCVDHADLDILTADELRDVRKGCVRYGHA